MNARGVSAVVVFAFLTAVVNVYAGSVFQSLSPAGVAAISFSLACVLFTGIGLARHGLAALRPFVDQGRDVLAINVTTAVAWLTVLFSLQYIEPAIVNVVSLAVSPVVIALAGPLMRRGSRVMAGELAASVGILASLVVLGWGSLSGRSAVGEIGYADAALGMTLAVASGLASAGNIVFSKRLSDKGLSPTAVMAVRFPVTMAGAWVLVSATSLPDLGAALGPGLLLAVISVIVPLYLLQIGVRHAEPITVSLLICLGPGFTLALQTLDGRLRASALSISVILAMTAFVALGTLARQRAAGTGAGAPRIAVVDAHSTGGYLPDALRARGAQCIHVDSGMPDVHLTLRASGFVASVRHDGDLRTTVAALQRLSASAVVAGAESGVELADELNAALGTPGNGMSRPRARRNKFEMVEALREANVAHAATIVSSVPGEIVQWAESSVGWPVVLKPVASAGTDNVVSCASAEEIRAAAEKIMSARDRYGRANSLVLAQEFLAGDEYFVNSVSRDGVHRMGEIWRYYKRHLHDGHIVFDHHEPIAPDDPIALRLGRYTREVLDALEIRNGAGHSEIMFTERGPVLVECGARLGGGQVPHINMRCLGTSQVDLLALSLTDPPAFATLDEIAYRIIERPRHVSLINPYPWGRVPPDDTLAEIRALPSYAHDVLAFPAGHQIPRTIDVVTSPGFVYLISPDRQQIINDYARIREIEREYLYTSR
ncbi:ATP-grasp domain-containing protein [Plantactinospora sp. B6F1]|uniref:ATP-grasp domain-containing protein n=1 Tax=Plantactinospora sp. B6F1 TaxID=3158971 RepID=UPI0032D9A92F